MKKEKALKRWLFWFSFALASIMVYKFLDNFSAITSFLGRFLSIIKPFLFAVLIAYLLYLPCKKVEEAFINSGIGWLKRHRRGFAVFTVYLIAITILFILINFIWPALLTSVMDLTNNIPGYYKSAIDYFANAESGTWQARIYNTEMMERVQEFNFNDVVSKLFGGGQIGEYLGQIMGAASTIFDVFVSFIVSIYILAERTDIRSFFKNVCKATFNEKKYQKIRKYFLSTNTIFAQFIAGQLLDAVIVGTAMSIALTIMNVKYALVLGYMIGLFNLIPYFGAIFGSMFAGLVTIFTGGLPQALWLGFWALVIQQIDGNIINPRILGNNLKISPILVIFAVTVGGAYFGILGMFLGVPATALIKIIVNDTIEEKIYEREHPQLDDLTPSEIKARKIKMIEAKKPKKTAKTIKKK